jgi:hypothetical protein
VANWKWMFPPGSCLPCKCKKKTWRSTKSRTTGVWSAPVLVDEDIDVPCSEGKDWYLVTECVAEFVQYVKCDQGSTPPTPSISAPLCVPGNICPTCCADSPTTASINIPANWGFLAVLGSTLPGSCRNPYEGACPPSGPSGVCNGCDNIVAKTVIATFGTLGGGCGFGVPFMSCPFDKGSSCGVATVQVADPFICCGYNPYAPGMPLTMDGGVSHCISVVIAKHSSDASCRLFLEISQTVNINCGFTGDRSLVGSRVYASGLLGGSCIGAISVTDSATRGGTPIAGSCGSLCDAMPTSFTVTVA